jgi:nucleotide-binding universal stress UspA family protein
MLTLRKILLPTDFSARSVDFAGYVANIARKFGSEVTLFHAFDMHDPFGYGAVSSTVVYGACKDTLRSERQIALAEFGKEAFAGLTTVRVTETGDAADCIISYAEEHGSDLIFIPTHGRGRFRRLLLGSVTSKVLHDARVPVWTTAHSDPEHRKGSASPDIRSIVCAVDLSQDTVRVIRAAADLAAAYGAGVRIVHVIPAAEAGGSAMQDEGFRRLLFDLATEQLAARQQEAGTCYETCLKDGSVATALHGAATTFNVDLIVIGRGRLQGLLGRLRTNVSAIIRESPCPVLSV